MEKKSIIVMKPSSLHPSSRLERGIRNRRVNAEAPF
jgi:hypothetical protein